MGERSTAFFSRVRFEVTLIAAGGSWPIAAATHGKLIARAIQRHSEPRIENRELRTAAGRVVVALSAELPGVEHEVDFIGRVLASKGSTGHERGLAFGGGRSPVFIANGPRRCRIRRRGQIWKLVA
jgi:hypothetical protein